MESIPTAKALFLYRADALIETMISELDPSSPNYWLPEYGAKMYDEFLVSYAHHTSGDFEPDLEIEPRLCHLVQRIETQGRLLSLYHPIGDDIVTYYQMRFNKEGSIFCEVMEDFCKALVSGETPPSVDTILAEINKKKYAVGFGWENVNNEIHNFLSLLRKIGETYS